MDTKEAHDLLIHYRMWRKSETDEMPEPKQIGRAINRAIEILYKEIKRQEKPLPKIEIVEYRGERIKIIEDDNSFVSMVHDYKVGHYTERYSAKRAGKNLIDQMIKQYREIA
jgi:hypothetical protein